MPRKPPFPSVSKARSRAKELEAMKAVLARAIDDIATPPRELPALVRRHIEVSELLADLEVREAEQRETESTRSLIDSAFDLSDI